MTTKSARARTAVRRGGRRRKGGFVPSWLLVILVVILALSLLLRCRVTPRPRGEKDRPPAPTAAERTKPKPEPRATKPLEPAPLPESPRALGTVPSPPQPLPAGAQRRLCLVIDDVGYRLDLAQEAAEKLPPSSTFAVIPFLPHSEDSARLLHERGFAVILHCPMEPEKSNQWPATPGTLLSGMPAQEVRRVLDLDFAAIPFAEGMNNHMGSLATTDTALMDAVTGYLHGRGFYFLDSRTSVRTVAYERARASGVKTAFRSFFLDDVDEESVIINQIDAWATRSEREGAPVAIGHLRPRTIHSLAFRLPYWRSKGITLVALRDVVH